MIQGCLASHTYASEERFIEGAGGLGKQPLAWLNTVVASGEIEGIGSFATANVARYGNDTAIQGDDRWLALPEAGAFFVFDGVGSRPKSHIAAQVTSDTLRAVFSSSKLPRTLEGMKNVVQMALTEANAAVTKEVGKDGGTTASGVILMRKGPRLYGVFAQIADSWSLGQTAQAVADNKIERIGVPETGVKVVDGIEHEAITNWVGASGKVPRNQITQRLLGDETRPSRLNIHRLIIASDGVVKPGYVMESLPYRIAGLNCTDSARVLTNDLPYKSDSQREGSYRPILGQASHDGADMIFPGIADDRTCHVIDIDT